RETPGAGARKSDDDREFLRPRKLRPPAAANDFAECGTLAGPWPGLPYRAIAKAPAKRRRPGHRVFPRLKPATLPLRPGRGARRFVRGPAHTIGETNPGVPARPIPSPAFPPAAKDNVYRSWRIQPCGEAVGVGPSSPFASLSPARLRNN